MKTKQALVIAWSVKQKRFGHGHDADTLAEALVALLDHGDSLAAPDFETSVRLVAANMHAQGKFYIEIGVDPKTKEVGWTFEPTDREESKGN